MLTDRPLILKRFPEGIDGPSFFQHDAPNEPPAGVRTATVPAADGHRVTRFIGGAIGTLLHGVQLGGISVNPWHSRIESLDEPDYVIFDLDPGEEAAFSRVVEVALLVRDALEARGATAGVKTSGSRGLHIYVPLGAGIANDRALGWAKDVAEEVAAASPSLVTVERSVQGRSRRAVYLDYLQNVTGKSVVSAFSLRARPHATLSMPLAWHELQGESGAIDPMQFTIDATTAELQARGRIWRAAMRRRHRIA